MSKAIVKRDSPFGSLQTANYTSQTTQALMQLSNELKAAGFTRAIAKHGAMLAPNRAHLLTEHVTFNSTDIKRFLEGEAQKYTGAMGFHSFQRLSDDNAYNDIALVGRMTKQVGLWNGETQEQVVEFKWQETRVDEYESAPPLEVIRAIAQKRRTFDYITIAELKITVLETRTIKKERAVRVPKERPVPVDDPLALGHFVGSGAADENNVRYLIAQWDDDIDLDALLGRKR